MAATVSELHDPGKRSRRAQGIPIIPALDGFRAFAVIGVVLTHVLLFSGGRVQLAAGPSGDWLIGLALGVDVLFVVSGFVLFLPTVAQGGSFGSVRDYAVRRLARLIPGAYLVIALVWVLLTIAPPGELVLRGGGEYPVPGPHEFLGHLLFLQTPIQFFDLGFARGLGIAGPLWTLSLELIFYALLPLIAGFWFRRPWLALLISAMISLGWNYGFANLQGILDLLGISMSQERIFGITVASDFQFPSYAFSFGAGMTAAWAYIALRDRYPDDLVRRWAGWLQPLALVLAVLMVYLSGRYGLPGGEPVGAPAVGRNAPFLAIGFSAAVMALILATCFAPRPQQWLLSNRLTTWLADISYGIYLIHYPVLAYLLVVLALPQDGTLRTVAVWSALTLALSIVWAYFSARFVERPARRWAHRYGRQSRAEPAPTAEAP